ncbi:nuclear transport factor 2 family protein [Dankookia rubra]|uniref:Nuclear transport factor 2 family protein n=1 Tax=Dankookia rubra TaxID=1442381 RepID=A0A4R5QJL6_9PROT|nr:nuclear transport factor 2 family protein [Dankookia rubra]TDH63610.1 nuclear transport factor 2 family protein [Dankookia rubra]
MAKDRQPLPPFTEASAVLKVRTAEDAWNSCDPARVALASAAGSLWRNRTEIMQGRPAITRFLARTWMRELDYRLIRELWAFGGSRIAARFAYEWHDPAGRWTRCYGTEAWEFDRHGLVRLRHASINDLPITEAERKFHWDRTGPRPPDHPGLSELNL